LESQSNTKRYWSNYRTLSHNSEPCPSVFIRIRFLLTGLLHSTAPPSRRPSAAESGAAAPVPSAPESGSAAPVPSAPKSGAAPLHPRVPAPPYTGELLLPPPPGSR